MITFLLEGINISFSAYNIYSRQALSILVLVLCFRFYYLLLKNDTISFPLNYPPFWIVTGLLVFYLGTVGLFAFYKQVSSIKLSGNNTFYDILMGTFCCILYGSWIIAIICQKNRNSYRSNCYHLLNTHNCSNIRHIVFLVFPKKKKQLVDINNHMQQEFQQQLLQSQVEVQEHTFEQIGKELHDNVGQLLGSTRMLLGITERSLQQVPPTLSSANETLSKAIQEIRTLSKILNKEWLEQFSFQENLQAEIQRINSSGKSQFDLFRWAWPHSFVRRIADHSFPDRPGSDTKCHQACRGHGNKYISACGKAIYTARHRR